MTSNIKSCRKLLLIAVCVFLFPLVIPAQGVRVVQSDCRIKIQSKTEHKVENFFRRLTFRRPVTRCIFGFPVVKELRLDRFYISVSDGEDNKTIKIHTIADDPENDPLEYSYKISGGKITGQGEIVEWNLTGVAPGKYTVLAIVNDGTLCGQWMEATIVVEQ